MFARFSQVAANSALATFYRLPDTGGGIDHTRRDEIWMFPTGPFVGIAVGQLTAIIVEILPVA
ncbi:hypothetical protein XM52_02135 [Roseovarius indicus]|uniref:Uncharacterized protein n=1 Tax=Roseovarius indicus TaxID=540747 RepID=A0A0T5PFF4_9RHOB|nr:hypothetical protein XM52_02135 [Roseovarius indicus]